MRFYAKMTKFLENLYPSLARIGPIFVEIFGLSWLSGSRNQTRVKTRGSNLR